MPIPYKNDKRREPRWLANERALAKINRHRDIAYHIIDISSGGVSMRHLGNDQWSENISKISLFRNNTLRLANLPVTLVADMPLPQESFIARRRCSFQFDQLTSKQQKELDTYIRENARIES